MSEPITRDEWMQAMAEEARDPYPDALTSGDLGKLFALAPTQTKARIRKWLAEGRIKRVIRRVPDITGRIVPIPAYLLVKPVKR